jgi:abortive infection bacteriophage resistance protein
MHELIQIYEFDSKLRPLVFEGIERIELTLRVNVAYEMGAIDPWVHLKREKLSDLADRKRPGQTETNFEILRRRTCELMNQSKDNFATHFRDNYDGQPPLWIAVETWDLGLLSNFYGLLRFEDQTSIIRQYGVENAKAFESWLSSLNHLRNICAHHGRLYRRALKVQPNTKYMRSIPSLNHVPNMQSIRKEKLYSALCALLYLHGQVESDQDWRVRLKRYFCSFPETDSASLADYGFPDDWLQQGMWVGCDPEH